MAVARARRRLTLLAGLAALAWALPSFGELYRCETASGETRFVGMPDACPGATPYEPRARVQGVAPTPPSPPSAESSSGSASPSRHSVGAAALWQRKKAQAEHELQQVEATLPRLDRMATSCNRGADWWVKDRAGLKQGISCQQIRAERDRVDVERQRLRRYLAEGLAEECRRAGCLPGWIR